MTAVIAEPPNAADLRDQVTNLLDAFLEMKARPGAGRPMPAEVCDFLRDFLASGGKRLRPLLCVIGWQAAGGQGVSAPVLATAASLEMFHAFTLVHDDVMDNSDLRRGAPTLHRRLAHHHRDGRSAATAERVGTNAAVLVGDLALAWSDELLHTAGLTPRQLSAVLPLIDLMRDEVVYGQYLDITAVGRITPDVDRAMRIVRYKTAKYTCERPLHIGAALTGDAARVAPHLSAYALPIGEAFQLRDDLLGVFGTPQVTGKPSLDDLRDGKHTVLVALALQRADPRQLHTLHALIGRPDLDEADADRVRSVLTATGAQEEVERMISDRYAQALHVLDTRPFPPAATTALRQLAEAAVARTS